MFRTVVRLQRVGNAEERRTEDDPDDGGKAGLGQSRDLFVSVFEVVADPVADPDDEAGQARLRTKCAAEDQRQQSGDSDMMQLVMRIGPRELYPAQDLFHGIRKAAVMLLDEGDKDCADKADDQIVDQRGAEARDVQGVRQGGPDQFDPKLHCLQQKPDDPASNKAEQERQQTK